MEKEPVLGIDFGTTYSSMAWFNPQTGRAEVLRNSEGEEKTPSVVYYGDKEVVVGKVGRILRGGSPGVQANASSRQAGPGEADPVRGGFTTGSAGGSSSEDFAEAEAGCRRRTFSPCRRRTFPPNGAAGGVDASCRFRRSGEGASARSSTGWPVLRRWCCWRNR
jgi:hypothetical protein